MVRQDAAKLSGVDIRLTGANLGYLKQQLAALPVNVTQPHSKKVPREIFSIASWGESEIVAARFPVPSSELADRSEASSIEVNSEFPGTICGANTRNVLASKTACGSPVEIRRNDSGRVDIVWNR